MKMFDDSVRLEDVSSSELHQLSDELEAYIKHPAVILKPNTHKQASNRLGLVLVELARRWQEQWYHGNNYAVSDSLDQIYATDGAKK